METQFFMAMIPPTCTHQEKQVRVVNGKPRFYEPPEIKAAREKLRVHLAKHKPAEPYQCGVRLMVKWLFPKGKHPDGSYRTTRPDTDNLQKLHDGGRLLEGRRACMLGNRRKILGGDTWHLDTHRACGGVRMS